MAEEVVLDLVTRIKVSLDELESGLKVRSDVVDIDEGNFEQSVWNLASTSSGESPYYMRDEDSWRNLNSL